MMPVTDRDRLPHLQPGGERNWRRVLATMLAGGGYHVLFVVLGLWGGSLARWSVYRNTVESNQVSAQTERQAAFRRKEWHILKN